MHICVHSSIKFNDVNNVIKYVELQTVCCMYVDLNVENKLNFVEAFLYVHFFE